MTFAFARLRHALTIASMLASATLLPNIGHAHTASPFLMPEQFDTKHDNITLQSGITVEKYYVPSRNYSSTFQYTRPDGTTESISKTADFQRFSVLEIDTPTDGTYHVQSAKTPSSQIKFVQVDGRWLRIRDQRPVATTSPNTATAATPSTTPRRFIFADEIKPDMPTHHVNVIQLAETYISKGAPTPLAKPTGKGFEIVPITHPNEVYASEAFEFLAQYDGKPLADLELEAYQGSGTYDQTSTKDLGHFKTDAQGKVSIPLNNIAGVYLISTQYPPVSRDNTQRPHDQIYLYGLTFQATP
ncbi:MAG: DUF4198 domain-containing protein [Pseudomonadota bacterium]|nr:DUF4198 domain-containing protein [Pseudomonadota bacterium]